VSGERRPGPRAAGRGFTLVEMLVVLAIVSLLVALAVPRYVDRVEDAREAVLRENLKVVRTAIDRFQADAGRYPRDLAELVERRYLAALPHDPITDRNDSWVEVGADRIEPGASGIGDVRSGAEGESRGGRPYAEF
jgi:general secretion pathway protein G